MFQLRAKNPAAAIEIGEGYASAVRVHGKAPGAGLQEYHVVSLPFRRRDEEGLWADFKMDERFQEGIDELLEWLGKPKRLSLALPDTATKTFFLDIENDAGSPRELRDVIVFKIQKFAPINSENTCVAYRKLKSAPGGGGGRYLAVVSSRSLVGSYERYLNQSGIHLGCIETAGLAAIGLLDHRLRNDSSHSGDFALVRIEDTHFTASIFNNCELAFSRTRLGRDDGLKPAMIAQELRVLNLFVEDQLKGRPFETAYFYGPGEDLEKATEQARSSGLRAETVNLNSVMDVPNELLHRPAEAGKLICAAALAARG